MALMFQRLARNFAVNGYFPTDAETLEGVLDLLQPADGPMRLLDPCCGEGVALAECQAHLSQVQSFGIELDGERARQAKALLTRAIQGDLFDCILGAGQFGLLWLNPPYGELPDGQGKGWKGRKRLEKLFYERTHGLLQTGGVMVLIVPHYVLEKEFAGWIGRHFRDVRIFRAATDRFKQVVVLGVRRRGSNLSGVETRDLLTRVGENPELAPIISSPGSNSLSVYRVPAVPQGEVRFETIRLDVEQLRESVTACPGLWPEFSSLFRIGNGIQRRPLQALSKWHLSLALAAGQIQGLVCSPDGRQLAIKGDTHKVKESKVTSETVGNRERTITTLTDRFVPVIRAIELTPGPTLGQVLMIR